MKVLNAFILLMITGIIISGCGGGSSGYTGVVSSIEPTSTVIPALTPAAPSGGGVFKIAVNIPVYELSKKDSLTANVLPYGSKTLRVTITGEAIDSPMVVETPIPSPVPSPLTLTVSEVPVGLNEALLEVLDDEGNFLAGYKYGFYMKSGETVSPPGVLSPGVVITGSNYMPQDIEISAGEELYFQNWDNADSTVETLPALSPPPAPLKGVIAAVQPNIPSLYDGTSYIFNVAGTYNYSGKSGTITVHGLPLLSGFSSSSGDEGEEITITGSNFSEVLSSNTVSFNGVNAVVNSASTTTLKVLVPAGAATGKISVTTPGGTTSSTADFIVTRNTANIGDMVLLPKGTYTLSQFNPTSITFTHDFYVGRYEITNAQYRQWPEAGSHHGNPTELNNSDYDNYPVRYVNWMDVCQYCNWLSSDEGLTPCYSWTDVNDHNTYTVNLAANGYRLPTEAEWEYACRGGTTTDYYWGDALDSTIGINKCWYGYNFSGTCTTGRPASVGYGGSHPWGLYDMSGNVWEWCHNIWQSSSPAGGTDPVGPGSGFYRVVRGGSWIGNAASCRSAGRNGNDPSNRINYIGFRPVRTVP